MRFISWNVNGLRSCMQKGFGEFFNFIGADYFCIQETKLQPEQFSMPLGDYKVYLNSAQKKGYSGTAVFCKKEPLAVTYGIGEPQGDLEGRVITVEEEKFYLVCVYAPNSQKELARLDYRMIWENAFADYVCSLDQAKPVVICGDLNVAHREIDLKNPSTNRQNAGFTNEEREKFSALLERGFVDTFRYKNGDIPGAYTWWSYMFHARENNAGWRIDYFLTSDRIKDRVTSASILNDVYGSDHCPVGLELDL